MKRKMKKPEKTKGPVVKKDAALMSKVNAKKVVEKIVKTRRRRPKVISVAQEVPVPQAAVAPPSFTPKDSTPPVYRHQHAPFVPYQELQGSYEEDLVVAQVRDPWWAYVYWDCSHATLQRLNREYGGDFDRGRWVLRCYDVSHIQFNGFNAHRWFDVDVDFCVKNWYVCFCAPGTNWCVDLGKVLSDGRFVLVARSNAIYLPLAGPSDIIDEEWMIPDDMFARLYGLTFGFSSGVLSKLWMERLKMDVTSGAITSRMGSPVKK